MSEANNRQIGGNHYRMYPIQHWDMMIYLETDYLPGIATKYVAREKHGIADLEKAKHCIEKMREYTKYRIPKRYTTAKYMQIDKWLKQYTPLRGTIIRAILHNRLNDAVCNIDALIAEEKHAEPTRGYIDQ